MPRRTLVELLHIIAGLLATAVIVETTSWAYPLGRQTIVQVGWMAAAVVVWLGIKPLRRAWAADHRHG
jgi:hypothetical protein